MTQEFKGSVQFGIMSSIGLLHTFQNILERSSSTLSSAERRDPPLSPVAVAELAMGICDEAIVSVEKTSECIVDVFNDAREEIREYLEARKAEEEATAKEGADE